jgi:hypothetical protein
MGKITKSLVLAGTLALAGFYLSNSSNYFSNNIHNNKKSRAEFKTGDIIAQTSKSNQSKYICESTRSPYSHIGIIVFKNKKPFVLEASHQVQYTSLADWIVRGEDSKYTVKRLKNNSSEGIVSAISEAEKLLGKPYDALFMPSDEKIYCSELVEKAFERGPRVTLGNWQTFSEVVGFKRYIPKFRTQIKKRWGRFPADIKLVTPESIMDSKKLESIYSNY